MDASLSRALLGVENGPHPHTEGSPIPTGTILRFKPVPSELALRIPFGENPTLTRNYLEEQRLRRLCPMARLARALSLDREGPRTLPRAGAWGLRSRLHLWLLV